MKVVRRKFKKLNVSFWNSCSLYFPFIFWIYYFRLIWLGLKVFPYLRKIFISASPAFLSRFLLAIYKRFIIQYTFNCVCLNRNKHKMAQIDNLCNFISIETRKMIDCFIFSLPSVLFSHCFDYLFSFPWHDEPFYLCIIIISIKYLFEGSGNFFFFLSATAPENRTVTAQWLIAT